MKIAIIEQGNGLTKYLKDKMKKDNVVCDILRGVKTGEFYDAVIAAPTFKEKDIAICKAHALVTKDCNVEVLVKNIYPNTVVTYGSGKSTLCISSIDEKCVVAVQREIVDSIGNVTEIGELCVPILDGKSEYECAVAAAMILCGGAQ